jgi:DNA-binding GntR family transcriptional regulator
MPGETFEGSRRYVRGRIVEALRALEPGAMTSIEALMERVGTSREGVVGMVERLGSEGLLELGVDGRVGLPN